MDFVPDYNEEGLEDEDTAKPVTEVADDQGATDTETEVARVMMERKRKLQLCPQPGCGIHTNKMRRHVVRYHLANEKHWFLFPSLCCWECKKWDIAIHVRLHGPFSIQQHMPLLTSLVSNFIDEISQRLEVRTSGFLDFVVRRQLGDTNSEFSPDELRVWDAYDKFVGLQIERERSLASPTRISSVLHWRTLQRLFLLADQSPSPCVSSNQDPASRAPTHTTPRPEPEPALDYIDAHCHVDRLLKVAQHKGTLSTFLNDQVIDTTGFRGCVAVFCDVATLTDVERWKELVSDKFIFAAVGFHPKNAHNFSTDAEEAIRRLLGHPKVYALGEIGLDYSGGCHRHKAVQQSVLRCLLRMAVAGNMPVVIHCRDAEEDCFRILLETLPRQWRIHLHCYTNNWEAARKWCSAFPNLCLGLTLLVAWGSSGPVDVARNIPLNRLLLETDAPYFPPREENYVPFSNPTMARLVALEIAHIRHISVHEILSNCLANTELLYGLH